MSDEYLPPIKPLAAAAERLRRGLPAPPVKAAKRRGSIPTIVEFCESDKFLGLALSPAQRIVLKTTFGEPLLEDELPLFSQISGRSVDPGQRFENVTVAAGARGGKTGFIMAPALLYHAVFGGHVPAKGETLRVGLFAQDGEAATVAFDYVTSYIEGSKVLRERLVRRPLRKRLVLRNTEGFEVEFRVFPATSKAARSYSFIAAGLDEAAFFRFTTGSANVDTEIEASIRRGMLNQTRPLLIKVSTPFARDGILWRDISTYFGNDDSKDIIVYRAPSGVLNPVSISSDRLAQEQRLLDPDVFAREYEAEFVDAASAWLPAALIEAAVDAGISERPFVPNSTYTMAIDPSGGGACAFALALGHTEIWDGQRRFVLDVTRRWMKPRTGELDLKATVSQVVSLARGYGVSKVYSDRYGGNWPSQFTSEASNGEVVLADPLLNRRDGTQLFLHKSDAFIECGPHFRAGAIRLLEDDVLSREFRNLETRPLQGGKVYVGRPKARNLTDDLANAVALAAAMALGKSATGAVVDTGTLRASVMVTMAEEQRRRAAEHRDDPRYARQEGSGMDLRGMTSQRYAQWRNAWTT